VKQKTFEEWMEWLHDVSVELDMDKFMRDDLSNIMQEETFFRIFIDGQVGSLLNDVTLVPTIMMRGTTRDIGEFHRFVRIAVLSSTLVGFKLGQEVQKVP
jgi:hypothetical protein